MLADTSSCRKVAAACCIVLSVFCYVAVLSFAHLDDVQTQFSLIDLLHKVINLYFKLCFGKAFF